MRAIITSLGEATTDICHWSLKRNGFDVYLLQDSSSSLWGKLKWIYTNITEDFLRIDADVIPNRRCTPDLIRVNTPKDVWWVQFLVYDWLKQDLGHGGAQLIRKEALPALRANIGKFKAAERPESQMFRLPEFDNPRRCVSSNLLVGLHGYGQTNIERVKETKKRRKYYDDYDWELYDKLKEYEIGQYDK